jgi:hypothetical protein
MPLLMVLGIVVAVIILALLFVQPRGTATCECTRRIAAAPEIITASISDPTRRSAWLDQSHLLHDAKPTAVDSARSVEFDVTHRVKISSPGEPDEKFAISRSRYRFQVRPEGSGSIVTCVWDLEVLPSEPGEDSSVVALRSGTRFGLLNRASRVAALEQLLSRLENALRSDR